MKNFDDGRQFIMLESPILSNVDSTVHARIWNDIKDLKKAKITQDAVRGTFSLISTDNASYD